MGDRALVIVHDGQDYSPITYLHHDGHNVPEIVRSLHARMKGREGDVSYACARLVGTAHERIPGNLSLGVFALPDDFKDDPEYLTDLSHGDAGVILYHCGTGEVRCYGGYTKNTDFAGLCHLNAEPLDVCGL